MHCNLILKYLENNDQKKYVLEIWLYIFIIFYKLIFIYFSLIFFFAPKINIKSNLSSVQMKFKLV